MKLRRSGRLIHTLGPALVFLDQFGYSEVSIELVARVLAFPHCEVLSCLDYKFMNRFISDRTKWAGIAKAFGGEQWKPAIDMQGPQRQSFLGSEYRLALMEKAGARYVWDFAMHDKSDALLYWLFFSTGSLRGLEEMKRAMEKVSRTGEYRFSDRSDPKQLSLLEGFTQDWLAERLSRHYAGKRARVSDIRTYVLTETNCRLYAAALGKLLASQRLKVVSAPPGWKSGFAKYPDMVVQFADP